MSIEIIKTYQGTDVSVSQCLVTLEGFIGDTNEQELEDGTVLDASDAVTAINGLIWSMERREAEIERLRELAYAPDGKEYRSMVFEEASKRLPLQEEIARLQSIVDTRSLLPNLRCDSCDNGVDAMWGFCAWCGTVKNWPCAVEQTPQPDHDEHGPLPSAKDVRGIIPLPSQVAQRASVRAFVHAKREEVICGVLQEVAELPDRTSPDDAPEMMMVTAQELRAILEARLSLAPSSE